MSKETKDHILIPALIAAAAAYFGFKGKSENLGRVAKDLVNKAIKDQTQTNHQDNAKEARSKRRYKRLFRDRYYS